MCMYNCKELFDHDYIEDKAKPKKVTLIMEQTYENLLNREIIKSSSTSDDLKKEENEE